MTPPVPPLGWSWQMKEWLRWKNLDVAVLWCWGSLLVTGWVVPHSHYLKQLPQAIRTSSVFTCLNYFLHQTSHHQTSRQMFHCRCKNVHLEACIHTFLCNLLYWKKVLATCKLPSTCSTCRIQHFNSCIWWTNSGTPVTPVRNRWWMVGWMDGNS